MITSTDSRELAELCGRLAAMAIELDGAPRWPAEQLRLCGEYGVFEWFIAPEWGIQVTSWTLTYLYLYFALGRAAFIRTHGIGRGKGP